MKHTKTPVLPFYPVIAVLLFIIGVGIGVMLMNSGIFQGLSMTSLLVNVQTEKEETKRYTTSVEYPQFKAALNPLNRAIKMAIAEREDEFKKIASTNWDEMAKLKDTGDGKDQTPFPFLVTWASQQLNGKYISIVMRFEDYTGGANMQEDVVTFNYDVANSKFISLSELFPAKPNLLSIISDRAKLDLTYQLSNASQGQQVLFDEGLTPTVENFSRFTFDEHTVTFYFPKYQVAPGAFGEQKVMIERDLP